MSTLTPDQAALLEKCGKWDVGRDPRKVSREELIVAGHKPMSPLRALRLRCLDCCAGQSEEVRKCTAVRCPSGPFRAGKNPWRAEPTDAQREERRQQALERGLGVRNQAQGACDDAAPVVPATPPPPESYPQAKPVPVTEGLRHG